MGQKEPFHRTIEHHDFEVPVDLNGCDDLIQLRNGVWAEDV